MKITNLVLPNFTGDSLQTYCRFILLASIISIALVGVQQFKNGITLDTDLKSMSPDLLDNKDVQNAVNTLASSVENRFTLLLVAKDYDDIEEALAFFQEDIDWSSAALQRNDTGDNLDTLLSTLTPYRFNLLAPSSQEKLATLTSEQWQKEAAYKLHSIGSNASILPLTQDPLGLFSDYILHASEANNAEDSEFDIIEKEHDGGSTFYAPVFLQSTGNALKLEQQDAIVKFVEGLEIQAKALYPDVGILHSGVFFFASEAAKESKRDINIISAGSTIGIILFILLAFGSLKPIVLPALSIVVGISSAFILNAALFGSVHILTIVFGASLIGIVIDYSLHYFYHSVTQAPLSATKNKTETDEVKTGNSDKKALHSALVFSLVTSVIGYGALAFSPLVSLKHIAIFSTTGLLFAWLTVVSVGPWLVKKPLTINPYFLPKCLDGLSFLVRISIGKQRLLVLTLFAVAVVTSTALKLDISDNPRAFFTPSPSLLEQERTVGNIISSYEPGQYIVFKGESEQSVYQRYESFRQTMVELSKPHDALLDRSILSFATWVPSPRKQQENYAAGQVIYGKNGEAGLFLSNLGVNNSDIDTLNQEYQEIKGKHLSATTFFQALSSSLPPLWLKENGQHFGFALIAREADKKMIRRAAQVDNDIFYIHTADMAQGAIKSQRQSATWLLVLALMLVAALVVLRYRKLSHLSLILVPLSAIGATLLVLAMVGQALTLFHIMAMFLVLGLGMDYVIFAAEITDRQDHTLQAITLSAITSLLSFGLLSLSNLPIVSAFGTTVLIGNTVNLIGAIVLSHYLFSLQKK